MQSTTIVAFDQHAATTVAAVLLAGERTPALHSLTSDTPTILRFVERLHRQQPVRCCYEAGPCGFELQRALTAHEIPCDIIAPALIPRRPGDRVKTDRRDASHLAVLYRADALTPIHIPTEQEEAARDLLRCREGIRADLLRARHRLSKFLLRHDRRFPGPTKAWTPRHTAWLRTQQWSLPALEQTCAAYVRTVDEALERLRAVDGDLRDLLTIEPLRARVTRLRCFRGIDDLTALTIAAELGDARRFPTAPSTMAFVGLNPSEHSSGTKRARGRITKAGNAHLRRVRRGSVALSAPSRGGAPAASPPGRCRAADRQSGMARATPPGEAISPTRGARQTQIGRRHRHRARTHRLCLGGADPLI